LARSPQSVLQADARHGSKAAYRGDKVTRKVWAEIIGGEYVAQSYAAPARAAFSSMKRLRN